MNAAAAEEEERDNTALDSGSAGAERRLTIINHQVDSRDLFVGTRDIVIMHGRDAYHLRLTGQNKLILTK